MRTQLLGGALTRFRLVRATKTVKRAAVLTSVRRHGSPTPCAVFMNWLTSPSGGDHLLDLLRQGSGTIWAQLPTHRVASVLPGGEQLCWSTEEADAVVAKVGASVEAVVRELHENRELESQFAILEELGVDILDWGLVQEETVSGERLPTRYACWMLKPSPPSPLKWPDRGCCRRAVAARSQGRGGQAIQRSRGDEPGGVVGHHHGS